VGGAGATARPFVTVNPELTGMTAGGIAAVGDTLTASTGSWSSSEPLDFSYQWQRCSYGNAVSDSGAGPIGYWRLDDSGDAGAADSSIYDDTGSYFGGVAYGSAGALTSDADKAVTLGGNAGINVPVSGDAPSGTAPVTIEAWINAGSFVAGTSRPIAASSHFKQINDGLPNGTWSLSLSPTSSSAANLVADFGTGPEASASTLSPDTWYFVVATDDGSMQRLYINGSLDASFAATSSKVDGNFTIGYVPGHFVTPQIQIPAKFFNGKVDDVALYDSVLSPGEVAGQYTAATTVGSAFGCEDIVGATSSTYTVTAADKGAAVQVGVTGSDADEGLGAATSSPTAVAGVATVMPPAPVAQTSGPIIDSGTVTTPSGAAIAGAVVSLYPNEATFGTARPGALATTTTASDGSYAIHLANTGLVTTLADGSGYVNLTRAVYASGVDATANVVRQYDATGDDWLDENGPLTAATTVVDSSTVALQSVTRIPFQGCPPIRTKYGSLTSANTLLTEVHAYGNGETVSVTYGRSADTTVETTTSTNPSSGWSASGSIHVGNARGASAGASFSANYGRIERITVQYQRYKIAACQHTTYENDGDTWTGSMDNAGGDVSSADGHCLNSAYNNKRGHWLGGKVGGKVSWFSTGTESDKTFSAAVSVFGATLWAKSGYSANVRLTWNFPTANLYYYLCGNNAPPATAQTVYAGPNSTAIIN
jgi:hypothetical protein